MGRRSHALVGSGCIAENEDNMKTALLFPGQGSQKVGMGKALAQAYPEAKRVYEEADDALGFSVSSLCFDGPEQELNRTKFTQPAIVTTSIAVFRTLVKHQGEFPFDFAAGHSLGEFSALVATSALQFSDALKLVHLRGDAMQRAVPQGQGAMAAILGLDAEGVAAVCTGASELGVCEPANLNGGGQIVISGGASAVDRAMELAKQQGAKRVVPLTVSAPFHCSLMAPAAEELATALETVEISRPVVPVVANFDAKPNSDANRVKQLLVDQVTGSVQWEGSIQALSALGVTQGLELGCGSVLRGLVRRINREIAVTSIGEPEHIGEPKQIEALEKHSGDC